MRFDTVFFKFSYMTLWCGLITLIQSYQINVQWILSWDSKLISSRHDLFFKIHHELNLLSTNKSLYFNFGQKWMQIENWLGCKIEWINHNFTSLLISDNHNQSSIITLIEDTLRTNLNGIPGFLDIEKNFPIAIKPYLPYQLNSSCTFNQTLIQEPVPNWGLDRIDQPSLPLDDRFEYPCIPSIVASKVQMIVIDTGIDLSNSEFFFERARWGINLVENSPDTDEEGHGTFVAGLIGGLTYGVFKSSNLIAVKALDKNGEGDIATIIEGLEWSVNQHKSQTNGTRTITNLSLGGTYSRSLNRAVDQAAAAGLTIIAAAGNDGINACLQSPSSASGAITVGATTKNDTLAIFSNVGQCVDILAPGQDIQSCLPNNQTSNLSGTSFAAPLVSGIVGTWAALNSSWDPSQVRINLRLWAAKDKIRIPRTLFSPTDNFLAQLKQSVGN